MKVDKSIVQIREDVLELNNILTENGGELTPDLDKRDIVNKENLKTKVPNISKAVRYNNHTLEYAKSEVKRLQNIIKRIEKTNKFFNDIVADTMLESGIEEIDNGTERIILRSSTQTVVEDKERVPQKYRKYSFTVDKTLAKEDIKKGDEVPGIALKENKSVNFK